MLQLTLAFVAVGATFAFLQVSTTGICCGDFDGYYHIRWSQLLWKSLTHGTVPAFVSLPLTTLSPSSYADQHFLFHLFLAPFTWPGGLVGRAKVAAVFFATLAVVSCFWLLARYRVNYEPLWLAAIMASSSLFLERMSMTRAQSVSLLFIVIGIALLFDRRYRWLAVVGFVYAWTYNLFVVLFVMAVIWAAVSWWTERRLETAPMFWSAAGIVAGLLLNPYVPRDLHLFWENVTAKAAILPGVGSEWYPLPSWLLLISSFVAFGAMAAAFLGLGSLLALRDNRKLRRPLFLIIFATLLLIATARSKRFTEYWPPVAVLAAAFTWKEVEDARDANGQPKWRVFAPIALLLLASVGYEVNMARLEMQSPVPSDQYRAGSHWLREHVPAGEIVFNTNWDDFPKLFYYDPTRPFVSGLDPMYLSDANPELGRLYEGIANGEIADPAPIIRTRFRARYVFAGKPLSRGFYYRVMFSGEFEKVYEDAQCVIFKVRDDQ